MLEELKKKCHLRMAKCCGTCYHFATYDEDFGANYQQYCECQENGDETAKPGEECFFEVSCYNVCDHWRGKDEKGNPIRYILKVDAEPRYPEDAYINGERENNDNPKMPFLVKQEGTQCGWCWKLDIDIETGEIIGWPRDKNAKIHYKVCDCFRMKYGDKEYYDYVPPFMAIDDAGYGDYIRITIEDGHIKNWSETECRRFLDKFLNEE